MIIRRVHEPMISDKRHEADERHLCLIQTRTSCVVTWPAQFYALLIASLITLELAPDLRRRLGVFWSIRSLPPRSFSSVLTIPQFSHFQCLFLLFSFFSLPLNRVWLPRRRSAHLASFNKFGTDWRTPSPSLPLFSFVRSSRTITMDVGHAARRCGYDRRVPVPQIRQGVETSSPSRIRHHHYQPHARERAGGNGEYRHQ